MNEQEFKSRIEQRWGPHRNRGRRLVGAFLLLIGAVWLARASGAIDFPHWVFSWPMILIGVGLFSGIRHNFRHFGWIVPVIIGSVFLLQEAAPELQIRPYVWPIVLMVLGLLFLLRSKKNDWQQADESEGTPPPMPERTDSYRERPKFRADWQQAMTDGHDVIDATAIFGGVKKHVLSKNFKGGDITTFMGGAEINLLQADCNGRAMIDCFNMFGGTKLIVPADWDVQSGLVTVFGGIEDKRQPAQLNPNKVLYLDGTCIFGGVEIKSF